MILLDLIQNLKKTAATDGGEWSGPCPWCGGHDRFRVWPGKGKTGRYWCRGCSRSGDGIALLMERGGLTYVDACLKLGVRVLTDISGLKSKRAALRPQRQKPWQERSHAFVERCQEFIWDGFACEDSPRSPWEFLRSRGLTNETIRAAGLGWNPWNLWEDRESWGLPSELNHQGNLKKLWLPAGLVIPLLAGGEIVRLRVRRSEPGDGARYIVVSGSDLSPMILGTGPVWVVVESELDGILLHQEAEELVGVVALGSATSRPDQETDRVLKEAETILIALDSDDAGAKEAWGWWKVNFPTAKRWPVPVGKDPGEAYQKGLALRAWVIAGLPATSYCKGLKGSEPGVSEATGPNKPASSLPGQLAAERPLPTQVIPEPATATNATYRVSPPIPFVISFE